jgi:hypothetical protein
MLVVPNHLNVGGVPCAFQENGIRCTCPWRTICRTCGRRSAGGVALWGYGTLLAHSSCQNAVMTALLALGAWPAPTLA